MAVPVAVFPPSPNRESMNRLTPAVWMVCVQSEESHLGWCASSGCCQSRGWEPKNKGQPRCRQTEEVTRHSRCRTEPGGFLWGGSTTPPVCETANCFLFLLLFSWLFSSSCMPLLPFLALSSAFKRKQTASRLRDKSRLVNPSPRLTFKRLYLQKIQPLLTWFHLVFIWSFCFHHPLLLLFCSVPLSKTSSPYGYDHP